MKLNTTKEAQAKNLAQSNFMDKVMMGAAAFVLVGLSYNQLLHFVRATEPTNYILSGIVVGFLLFMILSPIYRK